MAARSLIVTFALLVSTGGAQATPSEDGEVSESCSESSSLLLAAGPTGARSGGKEDSMNVMQVAPHPRAKGLILKGNRAIPEKGYRIEARPGDRLVLMKGDAAVGDIECLCAQKTGKGTCKKTTASGAALCSKETCTGECVSFLDPFPDSKTPGSTDQLMRPMRESDAPRVEQTGP